MAKQKQTTPLPQETEYLNAVEALNPQEKFLFEVAREWFHYGFSPNGNIVAANPAMEAGMQRYKKLIESLTPEQVEQVNRFIRGNNPAWLLLVEGATGNRNYFSSYGETSAPASPKASSAPSAPVAQAVPSNSGNQNTSTAAANSSASGNSKTTFKTLLNAEMQSYIQEFIPQDNTVRKSALLKVFSGQPMTPEEAAWISQNAASDYNVAHTMQYYKDLLDFNADQAKQYASQNQNDPILTPDASALGSYALRYAQASAPVAAAPAAQFVLPPAPAVAAPAVAAPAVAAPAVAAPAVAAPAVAAPAVAAPAVAAPAWNSKNVTAADIRARAQQSFLDSQIVELFASSEPEEIALFTAAAKFLNTGEAPAEPMEAQDMFNYIQSDSPLWMSYVEKNYGDPYRFMDPSVQANAVNQNSGPVGGSSSSNASGSNSNPYLAAGNQKKSKEQFSPGGEDYQGQFVNNNAFEDSGAATSSRTYMDRLDDRENQNNADSFERQKNIRNVAGAKATSRMPGSTTSSGSTQEMYNIQPNAEETPYYSYEEKYLPAPYEPASYPYVSQNEMYADAIAKLAKLSEYPSNNASVAAMYPINSAPAPIPWQATYGMVNPMPQDEMYRQVARPFTSWQNIVNPVSQNEMYANIYPYKSEGIPNAPYEYDQFMFNRRDSITNTPQYSSLSSVNNVPQNQMYGFSPAEQANFLTQYPVDYREGANAPEAPRAPYASQNEMYDPFIGPKRITPTNNAQYATISAVNSVPQDAMYGITQRPQGSYLDQYPVEYQTAATFPNFEDVYSKTWMNTPPKGPVPQESKAAPDYAESINRDNGNYKTDESNMMKVKETVFDFRGRLTNPNMRREWFNPSNPEYAEDVVRDAQPAYVPDDANYYKKPETKYRRPTRWGGY